MDKKRIQADSEYSRCAVPCSARKSCFSLTIVWTGFVFLVTSMMAGGGLASGLNFTELIIAMVLGNLFLCVIAALVSVIAYRTGLTFALLTRYSFGNKGSKLASLFVPVVNLGWYTIQASLYGHFIAQVFDLGTIGEGIAMMSSAIVMGIFAVLGIKAITIFGYIAIPSIVFLSLGTAIRSIYSIGGLQALWMYEPEVAVELLSGITIVIGTWILSTATCIADIMRYGKSAKDVIIASIIGLLGGNTLMIICGAASSIAMNDSDLVVILLGFGLVFPSILLLTTNIFTTNAANLYSTSLNLANAFNMDRNKMLAGLIIISAAATLTQPYKISMLFTFLNVLGVIVPPLCGIILADYYIVHKGKYIPFHAASFQDWNCIPWLSWLVTLVILYVFPVGLLSLNGLILGACIYASGMLLSHKRVTIAENETNIMENGTGGN